MLCAGADIPIYPQCNFVLRRTVPA
ncbi:hypothetical protein NJLHNGOC_00950 [Novacetimonas cocois]|uniref:Uncharacterized protein n=1 Tax=Novacetimonas cocois TaxID=1747507 RepID=A0A365Z373_9PROT|nr:hypothetical protein NJLHNGOC_00950 [Novacetimonas cocois]